MAIYATISASMVCLVVLAIMATTLMVIISPVKVNVLCEGVLTPHCNSCNY